MYETIVVYKGCVSFGTRCSLDFKYTWTLNNSDCSQLCQCLSFPFSPAGWMKTTASSLMEWTSRTPSSRTLQTTTACLPVFSSFPTARLVLRSTATAQSGRLRKTVGYVPTYLLSSSSGNGIHLDIVVAESLWLPTWFGEMIATCPNSLQCCGAQKKVSTSCCFQKLKNVRKACKINVF